MLDVYPIRLRFIFGCLLVSAPPLFKRHRFSASGNPCRKRKNLRHSVFFNKNLSLADCCILFTITIKKTKCSTALASKLRLSAPLHHTAPIFLPLLFCSGGVFPLTSSKNRTCITRAAKRISASIAVRGRG